MPEDQNDSEQDTEGPESEEERPAPDPDTPDDQPGGGPEPKNSFWVANRRDVGLMAASSVLGSFAGALGVWMFQPSIDARAERKAAERAAEDEQKKSRLLVLEARESWFDNDPFYWASPVALPPDVERSLLDPELQFEDWDKIRQKVDGVRFSTLDEATGQLAGWPFSRVRVALEGGRSDRQRIDFLKVRPVGPPRPPISGCLINTGAQGGEPVADIGINIDKGAGDLRTFTENNLGGVYLDKNFRNLEKGEQWEFHVYTMTRRYSYDWVIDIGVQSTSEPDQIITIGQGGIGGRNFRVTAFAERYDRIYDRGLADQAFWISPDNNFHPPIRSDS